ncbi:MAG: twin-arginine translocase subunit TatC [Austwickia sp.]|nr:twin-arginine translocase subunit TatC [Actinomycetota bacterium]MCO5308179.1 twin-arginine translocase subunit TatC [Austwickia sp.]
MALVEHLRELRNRFLIAAIAIIVAAIPGWNLYEPVINALVEPIQARGGQVNFQGLTDPFALQLQIGVIIGMFISSPIWLYQIWAFVVPGLTKKEKRTAAAFILTAVPLLLAGAYLAYLTLPKAVEILLSFTPARGSNIIAADLYLNFTSKFLLAFGLAFLLPIFLVAFNLIGILPAAAMRRAWRFAVIGIFIFAAVMTPTPDPVTMFTLALPMCALYFLAYGIAALNDRRRRRSRPDWADTVADDEASPL